MDCFKCKVKTTLAVNTPSCRLCVPCYHKHDPSNSDEIKNDVLFHIFDNRMRTTYTTNAKVCETKYGEPAIIKARDYLLSKIKAKYENIDEDLVRQLSIDRRTSSGPNGRTRAAATINDIHTVLEALETNIQIIPANVENVMTINPESLLPESVVSRLEEVEKRMKTLESVNLNLRGEIQKLLSQVPASEAPTGDLEVEPVDGVPTTANVDKVEEVVVEPATANAEEESAATEIDITGPIANASLNVEPVATKTNDTPVQSYAAAVGGDADAAAAPAGAVAAPIEGEGSDAADTPGAGRKMTGASKQKRNLDAQNIAATAAAHAVSICLSMDDAVKVGAAAVSQLVKAYKESNKQN